MILSYFQTNPILGYDGGIVEQINHDFQFDVLLLKTV